MKKDRIHLNESQLQKMILQEIKNTIAKNTQSGINDFNDPAPKKRRLYELWKNLDEAWSELYRYWAYVGDTEELNAIYDAIYDFGEKYGFNDDEKPIDFNQEL